VNFFDNLMRWVCRLPSPTRWKVAAGRSRSIEYHCNLTERALQITSARVRLRAWESNNVTQNMFANKTGGCVCVCVWVKVWANNSLKRIILKLVVR
jgi:hypothetical protein